jgi:hypothetical protein
MKKYKTMAAICFLPNLFIWSLAMAQSKLPPCQDMAGALNNCYGTQAFQGGASYVGEFKENKRNGQGTYIFPNGNKYVGEFRDDQMNGQGTLYLATGAKYSGGWKNGKYDGYGTYTHPDSRPAISGIFEDDKFIRAEKAPAQQNISSAEVSKDSQKNGSRYCFQTGFKNPLKIDTCDANLILINLKKGSGLVTIAEFIEPSSYKTTYIYPEASVSSKGGYIEETVVKYKRLRAKFEMENKHGCIYKGDLKETKTTVIETYRTISGTCTKTEKDMFEAYLKNEPTTYTKIFY